MLLRSSGETVPGEHESCSWCDAIVKTSDGPWELKSFTMLLTSIMKLHNAKNDISNIETITCQPVGSLMALHFIFAIVLMSASDWICLDQAIYPQVNRN